MKFMKLLRKFMALTCWILAGLWPLNFLWTWESANCSLNLSISDLAQMDTGIKLYDDHNDDKWDSTIAFFCQTKSVKSTTFDKVDLDSECERPLKTSTDCLSLKAKVTRSQNDFLSQITFWPIYCLQYGLSCVQNHLIRICFRIICPEYGLS